MTNENIEKNEFDDLGLDNDFPDQEVSTVPASTSQGKELTPGDMGGSTYIKNPKVGDDILLDVVKVVENPNTKGKNNITGEAFVIGLKNKDGKVRRIDIETSEGIYTISAWEVFFKLFGKEGLLSTYGNKNNSFTGAKLKITKNYNGAHANMVTEDLSKIIGKSVEETQRYKEEVGRAFKERRLYTIILVD